MTGAARLQLLCLALLWLQLVLQGQLQLLVAVLLPLVMVLRLRRLPLPKPLLPSLTLLGLVAWSLGASLGDRSALLQSACNLLWLLSGLKLLEARSHNDQRRCSLLLLLAVGLAAVAEQELAASLLQGLCVLLALASLLALEGGPRPLAQVLRRSGVLVGLALPLLVATFVLLPRLEPLWSLQIGPRGRTGLGERLAPGELATLVQDDSLAARVSFAGGPPPPAQRYWRVLVHERFDGSSWSAGPSEPPLLPAATPTSPVQERWMVEPSGLRQRPWSGRGLSTNPQLQTSARGTLVGRTPLRERSLYGLAPGASSAIWRRIVPSEADLQLPADTNPRLRSLGEQWHRQGANGAARVLLARQWFLRQGFRYTLEPGVLGSSDPIDRFLFETRSGFCEHYAASFSALMRAAGVPARVVVGYQGGIWQRPLGGDAYLELRNSDAHAWSEVWLPGRGWIEVDPTAWVVPERVRRSLAASLSPADQQRLSRPAPVWIQLAINQWEGLDYQWQLWVMGFDRQRQRELLGDSRWQGLIALGVMASALALGLLPLLRQRPQGDAPRRQLERLLQALQRQGHPLQAGESLAGYCQRVGQQEPALAAPLAELQQRYEAWRFGPPLNPAAQRELLACLRQGRRAVRRLWRERGHRPTA